MQYLVVASFLHDKLRLASSLLAFQAFIMGRDKIQLSCRKEATTTNYCMHASLMRENIL